MNVTSDTPSIIAKILEGYSFNGTHAKALATFHKNADNNGIIPDTFEDFCKREGIPDEVSGDFRRLRIIYPGIKAKTFCIAGHLVKIFREKDPDPELKNQHFRVLKSLVSRVSLQQRVELSADEIRIIFTGLGLSGDDFWTSMSYLSKNGHLEYFERPLRAISVHTFTHMDQIPKTYEPVAPPQQPRPVRETTNLAPTVVPKPAAVIPQTNIGDELRAEARREIVEIDAELEKIAALVAQCERLSAEHNSRKIQLQQLIS